MVPKLKHLKEKVTVELSKHDQTQTENKAETISTWSKIKDLLIKAAYCQRVRKSKKKNHFFNDEYQEVIKTFRKQ